jgi:polyhydroxybutyrate depolymerase
MYRKTFVLVASLGSLVVACGDDSTSGGGAPPGGGGAGGEPATGGGGGGATVDNVVGGDRPATVFVPSGYDPATPAPLLVLLHGYSATGALQELYFNFKPLADERGFLFVHPDGLIDANDENFWNATDACCGFVGPEVDDSAYLIGLVDEISEKFNVDPKRVYFAGHSNGGFMSHRMACDHADRVAAIMSLAGATWADSSQCQPSEPVSVVQVHGTADDVILYEGGDLFGSTYPSAGDSVAYWAGVAGCDPTAPAATPLDIAIQPSELTAFTGCTPGVGVELWTIEGGAHIPGLSAAFGPALFDFFESHAKP